MSFVFKYRNDYKFLIIKLPMKTHNVDGWLRIWGLLRTTWDIVEHLGRQIHVGIGEKKDPFWMENQKNLKPFKINLRIAILSC